MTGYAMTKDDLVRRLHRIEGQTRGIARMVGDDRYCLDVLDQITAVDRALKQVAVGLVRDHMTHCIRDAVAGDVDAGPQIDEAAAAIARLVKS